jgi:uncharacterized protein (DUF488 family)
MTTIPEPKHIYTIGHSNHPIDEFVGLLWRHGVTAIADVRSVPHSKWQPQFGQLPLKESLKKHGIEYLFLGKELGARTDDPSCYENGRVQYRRLAKTFLFKQGLERVLIELEGRRIALLCAEKEPLDCHRTLLVSRELVALGVPVMHIHADGHLEDHMDAMRRLLTLLGMRESDLFKSEAQLFDEACARQEERIAYVSENMTVEGGENF